MMYYDINENVITKEVFETLINAGAIMAIGNGTRSIIPMPTDTPIDHDAGRNAQARTYLELTDFKAYNGTLTAEQTTIREQCKVILEGSFIDPPSKLITA